MSLGLTSFEPRAAAPPTGSKLAPPRIPCIRTCGCGFDRVDPDLRSLAALAADVGGLARGGGAPDPDPLSDPALATAGADLFRLHRPRRARRNDRGAQCRLHANR